ncbi:MAG: transcriptional regulator, CdaR [Conexibacter sp.]|nr:transcriptional regulator, CdaR [Conexibacter sp.]
MADHGSEADPDAPHESAQTLIDALSVALRRPVLLDDPALAPLAYSRQWGEIDAVRSDSILSRGASEQVRRALEAHAIADASDVVRIAADPELGMVERLCVPLRRDGRLLGYIWLLDPQGTLGRAELDRVRDVARRVADLLVHSARRPVADEGPLFAALSSPRAAERDAAAADARGRGLLPRGPLVVCLLAPRTPALDATALASQAARRLSHGHAIVAAVPDGAALVAALTDPVLATLRPDEVARWLHTVARAEISVGQSDVADELEGIAEAGRRAAVALRVAAARPLTEAYAAWASLGADRLVAQLPVALQADLPDGISRLLRDEPGLVETLAAFLDAGGDVKATAARLALHRSGLYYRLHRIEELTGLRLSDGDDRLLAHLAVRLARLH